MLTSLLHCETSKRTRAATRRLIVTFAAVVAAWCALGVESKAQQVQTEWALAGPVPIVSGPTAADLRQQMLLDNIFFPHATVLKTPAPPQDDTDAGTNWLRFAVRPDGVDGWRPASQHVEPLGTVPRSPLSRIISLNSPPTPESRFAPVPPFSAQSDDASVPLAPNPPDENTPTTDDKNAPAEEVPSDEAPTIISDTSLDTESISDDSEIDTDAQSGSQAPTHSAPVLQPRNVTPAPKPLPPLTRQLMNLRSRVRGVLKGYYRKQLNSREHDPWEVMHGMLAYGVQSRIRQGGSRGEPVTSVGWLCYNKPCKGQTLMHVNREGELRAKYGVGLQGHLGQLLAMLAQSKVSADYPIHIGKHQFTIQDLIEAEKETCYPKSELTFKLLAFQYYLDLNDKWVNDRGEEWDFPRLIREELDQPIRGAACGGTHRLSSLSLTVKARVRRGEPLDGEYAEAAEFVKKYHQYAFQLQNRDGSLSTSWFRGRGDESDIDRRIKTTGHILEWLCYSLNDEELRDQRTVRAVSYLANLMYSNYDNEWEVGPMCHATHALLLYDERVFQPYDNPGYAVSYRPRPANAARPPRYSSRR